MRRPSAPVRGATAVLALLLFLAAPAAGHDGSNPAPAADGAALLDLAPADAALTDQDGRTARFVSDVIQDRIVVVSSIYTDCTTACPVVSSILSLVQQRLDREADADVRLVSITVDPAVDTPARLRAEAAKYDAGARWTWLTGGRQSVDEVLRSLGIDSTDIDSHPNVVLVGDGRSGRWVRLYGFPGPDAILDQVERLLRMRSEA